MKQPLQTAKSEDRRLYSQAICKWNGMCRLKMTTAQVAEISVTVHNSPVQDYTLTRTIIFHRTYTCTCIVQTNTYTLLFSSIYFGFVNMSLLLIRV